MTLVYYLMPGSCVNVVTVLCPIFLFLKAFLVLAGVCSLAISFASVCLSTLVKHLHVSAHLQLFHFLPLFFSPYPQGRPLDPLCLLPSFLEKLLL